MVVGDIGSGQTQATMRHPWWAAMVGGKSIRQRVVVVARGLVAKVLSIPTR